MHCRFVIGGGGGAGGGGVGGGTRGAAWPFEGDRPPVTRTVIHGLENEECILMLYHVNVQVHEEAHMQVGWVLGVHKYMGMHVCVHVCVHVCLSCLYVHVCGMFTAYLISAP